MGFALLFGGGILFCLGGSVRLLCFWSLGFLSFFGWLGWGFVGFFCVWLFVWVFLVVILFCGVFFFAWLVVWICLGVVFFSLLRKLLSV